ncbi:MAG: phosphorylcholine transferase LicD [Eubacteriales bacterium]
MTNDYGNLELHKVLLSAMKDIDRICRENGLKYYLYAGTLLGAVNHKGFIPWDDDVDIVMFPEDFQVFEQVLQRQYSPYYRLCTFENTSTWFSKMNKLFVMGTEIFSHHGEKPHPISVDLCVLHNIPDRNWQRLLQRKEIELINLVLSVQSGAVIPTSARAKLTLGNLAKIKREFWGKRLDTVMTRYDHKQTEYVGIMCNTLTKNPYTGRSGYETDFTKREWHEDSQYVAFEDTQFMTFSNIEDYLDYQFSPKWREPYPEEKRVTKHDVKSYEISPEVRERVGL